MIWHGVLLFGAAVVGGGINSVAGGGSFITFPALVVTGVVPTTANETSTVALWPGSVASIGAYRRELAASERRLIFTLAAASLVGGYFGAELLLKSSNSTFSKLIPFLMLMATSLFAFGPSITRRVRAGRTQTPYVGGHAPGALAALAVVQLVIATYGGYFGGGIGILMLAALGVMGMENIHEMNALKTVLAACINGVAVVTFIIARAVAWPQAILMLVGAIAGGYGGAFYARKLDPRVVRTFVIVVGVIMTIYFFLRQL